MLLLFTIIMTLTPKNYSLSITKWIHLHNGDKGMKEFFRKAYDSLKPGGTFVLEPQAYESYARRRRDSEVCIPHLTLIIIYHELKFRSLFQHIKAMYESIKFLPDQFTDFLLDDVHFKSYEIAGDSENEQNGEAHFF
jgi:7SK snRNA methylphosphate capping enzyme